MKVGVPSWQVAGRDHVFSSRLCDRAIFCAECYIGCVVSDLRTARGVCERGAGDVDGQVVAREGSIVVADVALCVAHTRLVCSRNAH